MKSILKNLPRVLGQGLVECLLFFPLLYIPLVYAKAGPWIAVWPLLVVAGYGAGYACSRLFRINTVLKTVLWSLAWSVAVSLMAFGVSFMLLIGVPGLFAACYRGIRMEQAHWSVLFPGMYYLVGLIIYGCSSFVLNFMPSFVPFREVLTWFGAAALAVTLFIINRTHIEEATLPHDDKVILEKRVRRQNRWLVASMLLLIAVLVLLPQLRQGLEYLWNTVVSWMNELFQQLPDDKTEPPPERPPLEDPLLPVEESLPPPQWIKVLEKIMVVAACAAAGLTAVYHLYRLARTLPTWAEKLSAWLNRLLSRRPGEGERLGYVDEVEKIAPPKRGKAFKRWRFSARNNRAGVREDGHEAGIRRLYRKLVERNIRQGYQWKRHFTPRETVHDLKMRTGASEPVPDGLVELYEQARYGGGIVDKNRAETVLKASKATSKYK